MLILLVDAVYKDFLLFLSLQNTKYIKAFLFPMLVLHSNQKLNVKPFREVEQSMGLHLDFPLVCKWLLFIIAS